MPSDSPSPQPTRLASDLPRSGRWAALPSSPCGCRTHRVQVRTEQIGCVNAILEGYDWLARVRTEDEGTGVLLITVPEDWEGDFQSVMAHLAAAMPVKMLDEKGARA